MEAKITPEYIRSFVMQTDFKFNATQTKLCIPIIIRMCRKMTHHIRFDDIKIYEDLIIDGHHRYLSSLLMKLDIGKVSTNRTSATTEVDWRNIIFDENDWDTEAKLAVLNELDARYNDLDLQYVNAVTNNDQK